MTPADLAAACPPCKSADACNAARKCLSTHERPPGPPNPTLQCAEHQAFGVHPCGKCRRYYGRLPGAPKRGGTNVPFSPDEAREAAQRSRETFPQGAATLLAYAALREAVDRALRHAGDKWERWGLRAENTRDLLLGESPPLAVDDERDACARIAELERERDEARVRFESLRQRNIEAEEQALAEAFERGRGPERARADAAEAKLAALSCRPLTSKRQAPERIWMHHDGYDWCVHLVQRDGLREYVAAPKGAEGGADGE